MSKHYKSKHYKILYMYILLSAKFEYFIVDLALIGSSLRVNGEQQTIGCNPSNEHMSR